MLSNYTLPSCTYLIAIIEEKEITENGEIPDRPDPGGINVVQYDQCPNCNRGTKSKPKCADDLVAGRQGRG